MRFLHAFDSSLLKVINIICGAIMVALLVIINVQVVTRSAFTVSLGGLADMPPFLMIYAIWLGAILAARADDHIKIQILDLFVKSEKRRLVVVAVLHIITAVALMLFTKVAIDYTVSTYNFGSIHNGTQVPLWYFYIVMPIGAGFMSLYYIVNAIKTFRGLRP